MQGQAFFPEGYPIAWAGAKTYIVFSRGELEIVESARNVAETWRSGVLTWAPLLQGQW